MADEDVTLKDLSLAIKAMAEIHGQDSKHERRLKAVLLERAGNAPAPDGLAAISEYARILDDAGSALHANISPPEAEVLLRRATRTLTRLFLPREPRNARLEELALLTEPTAVHLDELQHLALMPDHLRWFLSKLRGPGWLHILEKSGLIAPPTVHSRWVGHWMVASLKDDHPREIIDTLERILGRFKDSPPAVQTLARAAQDVGPAGRGLLLQCLSAAAGDVAFLCIEEVKNVAAHDEFVIAVADQVFNPSVLEGQHYPEPLFSAYSDGVTTENFQQRVQLLTRKLKHIPDDPLGPLSRFRHERGVPIHQKLDPYGLKHAVQLVGVLTDVLAAAAGFPYDPAVNLMLSDLPEPIGSRVRAFYATQLNGVPLGDMIAVVQARLQDGQPTVDDISLLDKIVGTFDPEEHIPALAELYGPAPSMLTMDAISYVDYPLTWMARHRWAPLMPAAAVKDWRQTLDVIAEKFGKPTTESIRRHRAFEMGPVRSPIAVEALQSMSRTAFIRAIVAWRPSAEDWPSSAGELSTAMIEVMSRDVDSWSTNPLATAQELTHPTYIAAYIWFLKQNLAVLSSTAKELCSLVAFVCSQAGDVEVIGAEQGYDYEATWDNCVSAALELTGDLANTDADLEIKLDELIASVAKVVRREQGDYAGQNQDPYERSLNHTPARAFQVLISLGAYDYRVNGVVRTSIMASFDMAVTLPGKLGEEMRASLAISVSLLSTMCREWLDANFATLFKSTLQIGNTGQLTTDMALKWMHHPTPRLFKAYPEQIWNAVRRDVPNALDHVLIAMLWKLEGFSTTAVIRRLKPLNKLSEAGETLGRALTHTIEPAPEMLQIGTRFWRECLRTGTDETLSGFGWYSRVQPLGDEELAELLLGTMELTNDPLANSYDVAARMSKGEPSENKLMILDKMIRRGFETWEQQEILQHASQAHATWTDLKATTAYRRLDNALRERGVVG
ncbi:hypothetical protein AB4Y72_15145 [Arthrobacter sp. YAF34]